jgi:hypothetical protein
MYKTMEVLPGQNEIQIIKRKRVRQECEECGEDAHYKHTWLLKGTRSNPNSKAYGRDDCSWCEDECTFSCPECKNKIRPPEGYVDCSVFPASEQFAHMFLYWKEIKGENANIGKQMADALDSIID